MFRFSRASAPYLIYAVFGAELLLFTWGRSYFGPYASPVILYALAIFLSLSVLFYAQGQQWKLVSMRSIVPARSWWYSAWARGLALAAGAIAGGWYNTNLVKVQIRAFKPVLEYSDIIPALHAYTRRWLTGSEVYGSLTWELGYYEPPTYLPATWFPFVLPEWLGFDYRLMAWGIFLVSVLGYEFIVWRLRRAWPQTLLLALLPFYVFYSMQTTQWGYIGITVEYMIVGYYALLAVGILLRSWPLQALALLLCLLSRYSLIFWAPLYLSLLFFQGSRKQALLVAGTAVAGILGFYIIPYLSHNWGLFLEVQRAYGAAAEYEWTHLDNGLPIHLYNGVGFAPFLYHYGHGSIPERIALLKTIHVALIVGIAVVAGLLYYRQRLPRTDYRIYAVGTLKLYLATFYAFVQVPYAYLATVGVYMSVMLVLVTVGLHGKRTASEDSPAIS